MLRRKNDQDVPSSVFQPFSCQGLRQARALQRFGGFYETFHMLGTIRHRNSDNKTLRKYLDNICT